MPTIRRQKYHEIDKIELKGTRIASRATSRIRAKVIQNYKDKKQYTDISNDIIKDVILPLVAASIISDLKGRKRSFIAADKSFDIKPTLKLAFEDEKNVYPYIDQIIKDIQFINSNNGLTNEQKHELTKSAVKQLRKASKDLPKLTKSKLNRYIHRIFRLPAKKIAKNYGLKITIHQLPQDLQKKYTQGKKIYERTKKLKSNINKLPVAQQIGKKSRIEKVPDKPRAYTKKKYKDYLEEERKKTQEEIKQKIKKEKKYVYDESIRHLRILIKDVAKIGVKTVDWQEAWKRLTNYGYFINSTQSLLKRDPQGRIYTKKKGNKYTYLPYERRKLLIKTLNKAKRKIRDKKERLTEEAKKAGLKKSFTLSRKYITKPIEDKILQKTQNFFFGEPKTSGSHRQYRSSYYYTAKALQELEVGQRRRRHWEELKRGYAAAGGIADLIGFFSRYNSKDIAVFLAELGGKAFFPETYKLGSIAKAANYVADVAEIIDKKGLENNVKEYQVKESLRLIQELKTLKTLIERYHPPVYNILQSAGQHINDNLREITNDLILKGVDTKEATKILTEAFKANGLDTSNPYKIETIFRTQSALAYSVGRYQADQHPAIQEILWGYKYVIVDDGRTRPQHRILDGVTLRKDDPFWYYFWPPNGWNCRCGILSLFEETEEVLPPPEFRGLAEIDKDFTFNPGLLFTEAYAKFAGQ